MESGYISSRNLTSVPLKTHSNRSIKKSSNRSEKKKKSRFFKFFKGRNTYKKCPKNYKILDSEADCKKYRKDCNNYLYRSNKKKDEFFFCKKSMFTKKCKAKTGLLNRRGKCNNDWEIGRLIIQKTENALENDEAVKNLLNHAKTQSMLEEHRENEIQRRLSEVTGKSYIPPVVNRNFLLD